MKFKLNSLMPLVYWLHIKHKHYKILQHSCYFVKQLFESSINLKTNTYFCWVRSCKILISAHIIPPLRCGNTPEAPLYPLCGSLCNHFFLLYFQFDPDKDTLLSCQNISHFTLFLCFHCQLSPFIVFAYLFEWKSGSDYVQISYVCWV